MRFYLLALMIATLTLSGCALPPSSPEAAALRKEQGNIPYDQDITIRNQTAYGYRSLPSRGEEPDITEQSTKSADDATSCIQAQLQSKLGLPENFISVRHWANNIHTVALHNPFTEKDGVMIDIHQHSPNSSTIKLYANHTTLSRAWRRIPVACH